MVNGCYDNYLKNFNSKLASEELIIAIRTWFQNNGPDCNAVIGISGGKDSSVVAALCAEALGKERVIGILMPDGEQKDFNDAEELCKLLDIKYYVHDIHATDTEILLKMDDNITNISEQTLINLLPRIRMTTLYAYSQSLNGRVMNTTNLSEYTIGYGTRWGDLCGDFAPILNFTSDEVMKIGEYLGLPQHLAYKVPADGLTDKTDEEAFGFTYKQLNAYIRFDKVGKHLLEEELPEEVAQKIISRQMANLFKTTIRPQCFNVNCPDYYDSSLTFEKIKNRIY